MKYAALNRRHRKKRRGCNANKPKSENAVVVDESNNNDVDIDAESSVHTNTVNSSAPVNNVNTDTVSATPDVSSSGPNLPPQQQPPPPPPPKVKPKFRELENKSELKITQSNIFEKSFEGSPSKGPVTRSSTVKFGLASKNQINFLPAMYSIIDLSQLNEALQLSSKCSTCKHPKSYLKIFSCNSSQFGLAEKLKFCCSYCSAEHSFYSSKKPSQYEPYDVNKRSVYASQMIGQTGLIDFCTKMGLPKPVLPAPYIKMTKSLCDSSIAVSEKLMNEAAKRLIEKEFPNEAITDQIANTAVTVDGTWQRRGHCSKHGIVFIISVITGEVLDYELKTLHCKQCSVNNSKLSKESFDEWYRNHEPSCPINHVGSSGNMEGDAAVSMFLRSIEKRSLRYTIYVGDDDSSSYGKVKEACLEQYGDAYPVEKEECLGHIQKRMGAGLITLKKDMKGTKLSDGKGIGGKGRLTKKKIAEMQNNYGYAIRGSVGDAVAMKNSIMAVLKHSVEESGKTLEEQHSLCPRNDWCKFWNKPQSYNTTNRLPSSFFSVLTPLFERLSHPELLSRCQRGFTQNQNESLNGVLWNKCLKTRFCGLTKLHLAVSDSVAEFNAGAGAIAVLMKNAGIYPPPSSMRCLRNKDKKRITLAARKITLKARVHRQKLRVAKKTAKNTTGYKPGAFGLGTKPEKISKKRKSVDKAMKPPKKGKNEPVCSETVGITFVDESQVQMIVLV